MRACLPLASWIVLLTAACSSAPTGSRVQPGDAPLTGDADDDATPKKKKSTKTVDDSGEETEEGSSAQTTQPASGSSTCETACRKAHPSASTLEQQWGSCIAKCSNATCEAACDDQFNPKCDATPGCDELMTCLAACPQ